MKMEHVALNVSDPVAMAAWYKKHLGFEIAKGMTTPPYTTFLRESTGVMMIEIYCNPPDQVPSYFDMNPLQLHLAFVSPDPEADKSRLLSAGATLFKDEHLPDGSHLIKSLLSNSLGFNRGELSLQDVGLVTRRHAYKEFRLYPAE